LRDRFGISEHMAYYSADDLSEIVKRSATIFDMAIDAEGAHEIARRSRGTPRVANRLLKRIRDFAEVAGQSPVDIQMVDHALDQLQVDQQGLDHIDRILLMFMIRDYEGGPV
ncbi:Holliday junction branch migration DNA helicase RuvB, partial [Lacticaseibacillus paracasei]